MQALHEIPDASRRKQVRLCVRADLIHSKQRYEGKIYHVIKDPVGLKYYRFNDQEYFVFQQMDGVKTLEEVRLAFEDEFPPNRLKLEDLESFARQLITSGLVTHESVLAGRHLYSKRRKQQLKKKAMTWLNFLYIKLPVFDPDRLLTWMNSFLSFIFTRWFLIVSLMYMLAAVALVTFKYDVFYAKLPAYNEFFNPKTIVYMWIALGIVKIIHEFGHGLSCKAFGGECHEMGALFMCFSPALYCNVTDSWTLADKWKRIIISFAGIYVELIIAATATFVWWYTPAFPFINNLALALMTLCSISTFVFNANPLMRFDGYYILADWLEIPNLRERSNKYLMNLFQEKALGIEVQPEPYMAPSRKILFIIYAILSYIYRWVVTFGIIWFLSGWLEPYKLQSISMLMAIGATITMFAVPIYRTVKNIRQRGRLPDMKRNRVAATVMIFAGFLAAFFFLPLPVSRVKDKGLVQIREDAVVPVFASETGFLQKLAVFDGQIVTKGTILAELNNPKLVEDKLIAEAQSRIYMDRAGALQANPPAETTDNLGNRNTWSANITSSLSEADRFRRQAALLNQQIQDIAAVKAPRDGMVFNLPSKTELLRLWDKGEQRPLCQIGDPNKLKIILPVDPLDYQLLKDNLDSRKSLDVSILVAGRSDRIFKGVLSKLPESPAKEVPLGLTSRGGGNLATRPPSQQSQGMEPLTQTYLLHIEIIDPDRAVVPGTIAHVKIHNPWKPAAWWVWRQIATALDLGLL